MREPKCASRQKTSKSVGVVFVICSQAIETLQQNLPRYDESASGRLVGGFNTYGYVSGNPLSAYDPTGLRDVLDAISDRVAGIPPSYVPPTKIKLPESLRPTEGLSCTARWGIGLLGATATWNSNGDWTYLGFGTVIGASLTITGSGVTVGSDANGLTARGSANFGNGVFGVSATGNYSTGGSNATVAPGVGTLGGSVGVTIGISRPRQ